MKRCRRVTDSTYWHVWFATKNRKWLLQGDVEKDMKQAIADVARRHGITLLEHETVVDHVHLLLELERERSLSRVMHLLKGRSSRKVFQRFPELKLDAGVNHFWQRRYGAKSVEPSALATTARYIRTQKERMEHFDR